MEIVFNWLDLHSGAVQAITTVILVIVTAIYAWYTKKIVEITIKNENKRNEPKIIAHLESDEDWLNLVYLVIRNYGRSVAKNVTFNVNENIELIHDKKLSELRFFKNGVKYFTPHRIIKLPIISMVGKGEGLFLKDIKLVIRYENDEGKQFVNESQLDFNALPEYQIGKPPIYEIANSIKDIKKSLDQIKRK